MNHTTAKPGRTDLLNGSIPPLEHGDRLTREEFERRYEAMPHLRKAELLNGVVYLPSPITHRPQGQPHLQLENGDHLTQEEFERRYDAMPYLKKAELLNGEVYMSSPVRQRSHARPHGRITCWLGIYEAATPGVEFGDNGTVRLGEEDAQPDVSLFILPECGGQVRFSEDDYMEGAPELTTEVAASSVSFDVHVKRPIYQREGVREHILWRVLDNEVDWFALEPNTSRTLLPDAAGIIRSEVFPGLWLDVAALLRGDMQTVFVVLQQGLASPEHAAFVAQLASQRRP